MSTSTESSSSSSSSSSSYESDSELERNVPRSKHRRTLNSPPKLKRKIQRENIEDSSDDSIVVNPRKRRAKKSSTAERDSPIPELESEAHLIHLAQKAAGFRKTSFTIAVGLIEMTSPVTEISYEYVVRAVVYEKSKQINCYVARLALDGSELPPSSGSGSISLSKITEGGKCKPLGYFKRLSYRDMARRIQLLAHRHTSNTSLPEEAQSRAPQDDGGDEVEIVDWPDAAKTTIAEVPTIPRAISADSTKRASTETTGNPASTNARANSPTHESHKQDSNENRRISPYAVLEVLPQIQSDQEQPTLPELIERQNFPKRILFRGMCDMQRGFFRIEVSAVRTTEDLFTAVEQELRLQQGSQQILGVDCFPWAGAPTGRILIHRSSERGLRTVLGFIEELRWGKIADDDCAVVFQGGDINAEGSN